MTSPRLTACTCVSSGTTLRIDDPKLAPLWQRVICEEKCEGLLSRQSGLENHKSRWAKADICKCLCCYGAHICLGVWDIRADGEELGMDGDTKIA
jgi:hypothetical protein